MTPYGVYIIISSSTKPPQQFPRVLSDTFLLQDISYQTYVNGVATSLHRKKKGLWPLFPLSTKVCKIENFKWAKDEVGILTSFKCREVSFLTHDPQGKLKEHLQQVSFIWSYALLYT